MKKENKLNQTIFICGMMGTGKSVIGKKIAAQLKLPFHDLDLLIEAEAGMKIPEIFDLKGEPYFRQLESDLLSGFAGSGPGVLALGGGSLQNQEITDLVKNNGILIFIDTPLDFLVKRLGKNNKRPLIKELDQDRLKQKIESLLKERLPYYRQAHITIHSKKMTAFETANEIIEKLNKHDL